MAYLSEENNEMYRRMLSADDERGPVQSNLFTPPPRTSAPTPTTVGGFVRKSFGVPGAVMTKGIAITGTSGTGIGGGKTEVAPMPKSFVDQPFSGVPPGGFPSDNRQKFMPLVYIGGAGLLLYFLFKK
jgi:hypothetical protein